MAKRRREKVRGKLGKFQVQCPDCGRTWTIWVVFGMVGWKCRCGYSDTEHVFTEE